METEIAATRIASNSRGGSQSASALAPGERLLDRYVLRERLGSGGFGEVWRAHDELLNREVAIKRILGGESERTAREAKAAARLSDPAIVALYEASYDDGVCHLISELVEGATLAVLIAEDALGEAEILEIGVALCDALAHAHSRGVIHRDVKPHNVLVPDERPARAPAAKLTDFGGALLDGEQALTRTGDVLGTLAYMAPEQSDGREAGRAADLYSLALVLYEALTGENPVRAATPAATVRRIGSRLPPLRRSRRDLPRALTAAIDRALLPSPRERGALAALSTALSAALADESAERFADQADFDDEDATDVIAADEDATELLDADRADVEPTVVRFRPARRPRVAPAVAAPAFAEQQAPASPRLRRDTAPSAADAQPRADARGWFALPRLLWLLTALALAVVEVIGGRPGLALIVLAGALPLLLAMPRRAGPIWLLGALAPVLGFAGLASASPAAAGQPRSPRLRFCLGGLAYWWLSLAELALGKRMPPGAGFVRSQAAAAGRHVALGLPALRSPARWEGSVTAAVHALDSLLSVSVLAAVLLWGAGALCLPLLVRGRSLWPDLARAVVWSAALLLGPALLASWLAPHAHVSVASAIGSGAPIAGAVLGALLALGLAAARARPPAEDSTD